MQPPSVPAPPITATARPAPRSLVRRFGIMAIVLALGVFTVFASHPAWILHNAAVVGDTGRAGRLGARGAFKGGRICTDCAPPTAATDVVIRVRDLEMVASSTTLFPSETLRLLAESSANSHSPEGVTAVPAGSSGVSKETPVAETDATIAVRANTLASLIRALPAEPTEELVGLKYNQRSEGDQWQRRQPKYLKMLRHDLELRHAHHRDVASPFVRRQLTAMLEQAKAGVPTSPASGSPRPRFLQGLLAPSSTSPHDAASSISPNADKPQIDDAAAASGDSNSSVTTAAPRAQLPLSSDGPRNLVSVFVTPVGSIVWRLLPHAAPRVVENMRRLIEAGFFNATAAAAATPKDRAVATLYRYEADFCMQGGGWPVKGSPFPAVKHEYDPEFPNERFAVSMARTADPDSATTEFSMMLNDNARWLGPGGSEPHGYSVFAHIIAGYGTLERLFKRETKKSGLTLFTEAVPIVAAFVVEM